MPADHDSFFSESKLVEARPAAPGWLVWAGSVLIVAHFGAVGIRSLAAPTGPWAAEESAAMAEPPQFLATLDRLVTPTYLRALKMTYLYRYQEHFPALPGVSFEIELRDDAGKSIGAYSFPDPKASFAVRYRQSLVARTLADDQPVQPPVQEAIPAPDRKPRKVRILEIVRPGFLKMRTVSEHLVPRDRPVSAPSDWSLIVASSICRHLCRTKGARTADFIRHTREAVAPSLLLADEALPERFAELTADFGELSR
jgi:hypothetical protein